MKMGQPALQQCIHFRPYASSGTHATHAFLASLLVERTALQPVGAVLQLRGGGTADIATDLLISIVVLLAVAMAARSGSSLMAAVFSTAPTGVPLSLWLVHRAAVSTSSPTSTVASNVEAFLLACLKGVAALASFCLGALALSRCVEAPSIPALLAAGYASWAAVWFGLRRA
jgi:hypothetical protein